MVVLCEDELVVETKIHIYSYCLNDCSNRSNNMIRNLNIQIVEIK